jgi:hypothetical protein
MNTLPLFCWIHFDVPLASACRPTALMLTLLHRGFCLYSISGIAAFGLLEGNAK